jgi:DnaJ-class molecular chaperone
MQITCPKCQGRGWVVVQGEGKEGEYEGRSTEEVCPECYGAGVVEEPVRT